MGRLPAGFAPVLILSLAASGPSRTSAADHFPWQRYAKQPDAWFAGAEAKAVADNVLSHQSPLGSWPKNIDTGARPYQGDPKALRGTFDNDATIGELRFLSRMFNVTADQRYRDAVLKGLKHILQA